MQESCLWCGKTWDLIELRCLRVPELSQQLPSLSCQGLVSTTLWERVKIQ